MPKNAAQTGGMGIVLLLVFPAGWAEGRGLARAAADPVISFVRKYVDSTGGGQVTEGLAVGDIDGDGRPDVVVGGDRSLLWYHSADWTPRTIALGKFGAGSMILVRDIDGDGRRDVVTGEITSSGGRQTVWFANKSTGWVKHVMSTSSSGHDIAFADLDGDGRADLVGLDHYQNNIVWLQAPVDPTTTWSVHVIDPARNAMGLAIADIDRDGRLDVVAGRAWYRNTGTSPWPRYAYTTMTNSARSGFDDYEKVTVLDLNGDGRLDIFATIFAEMPEGKAYAFLAPSDPRLSSWTAVQVDAGPLFAVHSQAAANFDGTGRAQIMVGETNFGGWNFGANPSPQIYLYRLIGPADNSASWERNLVDTIGTHEAQAVDLDGDGKPDIVGHWENTDGLNPPQNGPVHWWQNTTSTPTSPQSPYGGTARAIPGKIEAEHYDVGGEGVAYHDTTAGNSGGAFRSDNVDIEATTDTGGGYNIGWTVTGEWLEYTVNVASAGSYDIQVRVASPNTGTSLHVEFNGVNKTGTMAVPTTGGWQTWQTITKTAVSLNAGQQVMRLAIDAGGFNANYVNIISSGSSGLSVTIDYVSTGKAYSVATAQVGALYYIDRSYTINSLSTALNGGKMVRTANDDKVVTATIHLKFTVNRSATVYVCYDVKQGTQIPSWLNDGTWTATAESFAVTDTYASPMRAYKKAVPSGQVTLGGNRASPAAGNPSHYVVIVTP